MSIRIIATQSRTVYEADGTTAIVTLNEGNEVVSENIELKEALMLWGWAKLYDDTKPYPPRGIRLYETGKEYAENQLVINGNGLYESKQNTSESWVPLEWELILQGV